MKLVICKSRFRYFCRPSLCHPELDERKGCLHKIMVEDISLYTFITMSAALQSFLEQGRAPSRFSKINSYDSIREDFFQLLTFLTLQWISYGITCVVIQHSARWSVAKLLWKVFDLYSILFHRKWWRWELATKTAACLWTATSTSLMTRTMGRWYWNPDYACFWWDWTWETTYSNVTAASRRRKADKVDLLEERWRQNLTKVINSIFQYWSYETNKLGSRLSSLSPTKAPTRNNIKAHNQQWRLSYTLLSQGQQFKTKSDPQQAMQQLASCKEKFTSMPEAKRKATEDREKSKGWGTSKRCQGSRWRKPTEEDSQTEGGEKQVEKGLVCFFLPFFNFFLDIYMSTVNKDEIREQVTAARERMTKRRDHPRRPSPVSRESVNRNWAIRASRAIDWRLCSLLVIIRFC